MGKSKDENRFPDHRLIFGILKKKQLEGDNIFEVFFIKGAPGRARTCNLQIDSPKGWFVSICVKMVYTCQIRTYEAGRSATEAHPKPKRADLLQILLQIAGSD